VEKVFGGIGMRKANSMGGAARGEIVSARDSDGVVKQFIAIRPTMSPPGPDSNDWTLAVAAGDSSPFWEAGPPGRDGNDGRDGVGKDGKDGRDGVDAESLNPVGEWRATKQYEPLDICTHENNSWLCTNPNKNREPGDGSRYWQAVAKSIRGPRGLEGGAGQRGRSSIPLQNEILQRLEEIEAGGSGGSELLPLIFDSNAVKGLALYASSDGHCNLARANSESTSGVIGLCNSDSVNAGAAGNINADGILESSDWSAVLEDGSPLLSTGVVYYLSPNVAGKLTATGPATPGEFVVVIGRAASGTQFVIETDQSVRL
jgi:hypothetical protein